MSKNTILEGKPCIYLVFSWVLLPHPSQWNFITKYDIYNKTKYFHIYKKVYIYIYLWAMNLFVNVCWVFIMLLSVCLTSFSLPLSICLSTSLLLPSSSQLTPHPFDPNPFNDSTPPSPLKSVRKARASLCFFFVVQSVGLLDTSVGKIVTCERINRHYLHSCRFFRQLFRRLATNGPGLCKLFRIDN